MWHSLGENLSPICSWVWVCAHAHWCEIDAALLLVLHAFPGALGSVLTAALKQREFSDEEAEAKGRVTWLGLHSP